MKNKRIFLQKATFVDYLIQDTQTYFESKDICVKNVSSSLFEDMFIGMVSEILSDMIEWRHQKTDRVNDLLYRLHEKHRKSDIQKHYYDVYQNEHQLSLFELSWIRFKVCLERIMNIDEERVLNVQKMQEIAGEDIIENPIAILMDDWYSTIIDNIRYQLCVYLETIIPESTWDVIDIVKYKQSVYLVNYGDFRILSWEAFLDN